MSNRDSNSVLDIINKDLIELLDLKDLPPEKQEEYRKLAIETINNRVFSRLTDTLEEKGLLDQFQEVEENDKAMGEFLTKHGIDLEKIAAEEVIIYKAQMKTINDVIKSGIDIIPADK